MSITHIKEQVDIYTLPSVDTNHKADAGAQITIGDLHANAMKLIFLLIKQGIATNLSKKNYAELVRIYKLSVNDLTQADLNSFHNILNTLEFNNKVTLRLIGDELGDRGSNDYFILKILEKLRLKKVPVEILLSNHGVEFIEASEQNSFEPILLDCNWHAPSMRDLNRLIEKKLVSKEEVQRLSNTAYKPTLKAISYSLNDDQSGITLYSHAPIDVNVIAMVAKKLKVPFNDDTAVELGKTIDCINIEFQKYVQTNTVHTLYGPEVMMDGYSGQFISPESSPFEFLMWNRFYDTQVINRSQEHKGYSINYVHGHDPSGVTSGHIYNVDNALGKFDVHTGEYTVLYSHEHDLHQFCQLTEITNRLKKEYVRELKRHSFSKQDETVINELKIENQLTSDFVQQANKLTVKIEPLTTILKCIKELSTLKLPAPDSKIDQQLGSLSIALSNIENAKPGYKQWHQFVSLLKSFVEMVGSLIGKNWTFDKTYRGPLRNQFWSESPEIKELIENKPEELKPII